MSHQGLINSGIITATAPVPENSALQNKNTYYPVKKSTKKNLDQYSSIQFGYPVDQQMSFSPTITAHNAFQNNPLQSSNDMASNQQKLLLHNLTVAEHELAANLNCLTLDEIESELNDQRQRNAGLSIRLHKDQKTFQKAVRTMQEKLKKKKQTIKLFQNKLGKKSIEAIKLLDAFIKEEHQEKQKSETAKVETMHNKSVLWRSVSENMSLLFQVNQLNKQIDYYQNLIAQKMDQSVRKKKPLDESVEGENSAHLKTFNNRENDQLIHPKEKNDFIMFHPLNSNYVDANYCDKKEEEDFDCTIHSSSAMNDVHKAIHEASINSNNTNEQVAMVANQLIKLNKQYNETLLHLRAEVDKIRCARKQAVNITS